MVGQQELVSELDRDERRGFGRVLAGSLAGSVLEWYEFLLYGTAAVLVFGEIFFPPNDDPMVGIIAALLTYAVGFVARPIGGVIFGHFGDRYGRKRLLQIALLMVGASTFLIGVLPTYQQVGVLAPLSLVVLRFIQGFSLGGEWGGAVLLVAEHSSDRRRGLWASIPQIGAPLGNMLATAVLIGTAAAMSEETFLDWGWRIGFLLSAVVVVIGWYIRQKVDDSQMFLDSAAAHDHPRNTFGSLAAVVKSYPRQIAQAMGLRLVENILYYLVATFTITYLSTFENMGTTRLLLLMLAGHAIHVFALAGFGALSDVVGRRRVYGCGVVMAGAYGFVAYPLLSTGNDALIILAIALGMAIHGMMWGPQPAMMSEMFPTRMRYIGLSLGAQVTAIVAGSLAPVVATMLLRRFDSTIPIAIYVGLAAVISLVAVLSMRETRGLPLEDLDRSGDRARV